MIYRIPVAGGAMPKVVHFNRLAPFVLTNAEAQHWEFRSSTTEMDFMATSSDTEIWCHP